MIDNQTVLPPQKHLDDIPSTNTSAIRQEPVLDTSIEDSRVLARKRFVSRHLRWVIPYCILSLIAIGFIVDNVSGDADFVVLFILPIIAAWSSVFSRTHREFMQQFASKNGFTYTEKGRSLGQAKGAVFQVGHGHGSDNAINGVYTGYPFELYNHDFTTGSGKNKTHHKLTVLEINTKKPLPYILLDSKKTGRGVSKGYGRVSGAQKVELEGDFGDYFQFYIAEGTQVEALQIFSPDFMVKMIDYSKDFDVEFVGTNICIYTNRHITKRIELERFYELAQLVIDELDRVIRGFKMTQANSLHSSAEYVVESSKGNRNNIFKILFVGFVVSFIFIVFVILAANV